MAIAAVQVGPDKVVGDQFKRIFDLTFSGNYATGGEVVTALGTFKLRTLLEVLPHGGVAVAADLATAIPVAFDYPTLKFVFYEGSAAGTALSEKTNAEAYPVGCKLRVSVLGNPT